MDDEIASEPLSKAIWMQRFGKRLLQLLPELKASTAASHSLQAFRESGDTWPERAAERWVKTRLPDAQAERQR